MTAINKIDAAGVPSAERSTGGACASNAPNLTPVYSLSEGRKAVVAYFRDSWDAIDFVNANLGKRNLYLAPSILHENAMNSRERY